LTGWSARARISTVADLPWVPLADREPRGQYVVLLSYLPLRRLTSTPWFFRDVLRVRRQLARSQGLIGYSLRARPLRKEYWTLSVWDSERALLAFVKEPPHGDVMRSLRSKMGAPGFVRWRISGTAPLPSWEEAMARNVGGAC
jgi:hypothetical protein